MPEEITFFAETNYRGMNQKFGIKKDDRRRHMYLIGKTGMGKTTMLEHMVYSDIINGNGLAVVDPHGDFAEKMLDYIPSNRINDVIYFNPADIDYPIAFNVMEKVDSRYMSLVASGLIGVFKKIWADSWGPRLEYLLRNAILALLEYPGSTLLGVPRMLIDKEYRQKVIKKVNDPVVKSFWTDEFSKYSSQFLVDAISPIQNKVGQFLSNPMVRNIVSQTKSAMDIRDIMDNKKILIINLSKGRIGEDYSALLGAMMITKLQLAAMGRVDIPEPSRNDFYLYVDEFQNFATESFANILSEARKYRLNLIIAHQYIGQLVSNQNTVVRDSVFGNVGTIITFRIGAADAEFLEKEFEPVFMMNDLVNLPKYNVYLKLMIDGVTSDGFSATTLEPLGEGAKQENRDKIIKNSRQRYATPRHVIEEKIMKWSGVEDSKETGDGKAGEYKDRPAKHYEEGKGRDNGFSKPKFVKTSAPQQDDGREWHDAVCQKCSKPIKVPFKPDPARKTYCRECLKETRRTAQKDDKAPSAFPPRREPEKKRFAETNPPPSAKNVRVEEKITLPHNFISLEEVMKVKPVSFSTKRQSSVKEGQNTEERPIERKEKISSEEPVQRSERKPRYEDEASEGSSDDIGSDDSAKTKAPQHNDSGQVSRSGTIKPLEKAKFD